MQRLLAIIFKRKPQKSYYRSIMVYAYWGDELPVYYADIVSTFIPIDLSDYPPRQRIIVHNDNFEKVITLLNKDESVIAFNVES